MGVSILDRTARRMYVGYQDRWLYATDMLKSWNVPTGLTVLIASERFVITPSTGKKSQQQDAIKGNGALDWLAHRRGYAREEKTAASAKKLNPDDRLRRMGLYTPTDGGHANDATRHLLLAIESHLPRFLERDPLIGYSGEIEVVNRLRGSN